MNLFKRLCSLVVAGGVIFSSFSMIASANTPKTETAAGKTAYTSTSIVVDGVKDTAYDNTDLLNISHIAMGEGSTHFDPDFTGYTFTMWDEEYLYILTEVIDDNIVNTNGGSLVEAKKNDRITYYFDFANNTNPAYQYTSSMAVQGLYYGVHYTSDENYKITIDDGVTRCILPDEGTDEYDNFIKNTFKTVVKATPEGYNVETSIRYANLKYNSVESIKPVTLSLSGGKQIGFDVYIHDWNAQKTDGRVALATWSQTTNDVSWDYPYALGTLTVGAKPADAPKNRWCYENGQWKYYVNGVLSKNKFIVKGLDTVYVGSNGSIVKNKIITHNNKSYYITSNGAVKTDTKNFLFTYNKNKYVANKSGVIQKKKAVTVNGKKYITNKNGVIQKGNKIVTLSGKKYYVNKSGVAAKNTWKTYKKAKYRFASNCVAYKKKLVTVKGKKYYFDKNCKMVKNKTVKIGKVKYKFNSKGVGKKVK